MANTLSNECIQLKHKNMANLLKSMYSCIQTVLNWLLLSFILLLKEHKMDSFFAINT